MQRIFSGAGAGIESATAQALPVVPNSATSPADAALPSELQRHRIHGPGLSIFGEDRSQDVLLIGLCAAFSLIGWLMIVQGSEQIHIARAVARWPTTIGTIASVDMQEIDGSEGVRWRPQVIYYYSVNGRVIASTQLSRGQAIHVADDQAARAFLSKYPPQSAVTVHYNPEEVTSAVLETDTPRRAQLNLALGLVLAATGPVLLLIFGAPIYRRLTSPRRPPAPQTQ
jgi:Protein of unknown function (DUF3592)